MKRFSLLFALTLTACGGGVPVQLRVDEFTQELSIDEAVAGAFEQLVATGFLFDGSSGLPEQWPASLPDIRYSALVASPPMPIDLTPEPSAADELTGQESKYSDINQAGNVIQRIEVNEFVLRVESSTLTIGLPELRLQVADAPDASPDDRLAWHTIGKLPATAGPREVTDIHFEFERGGESFLQAQLSDEQKELAMRVVGKLDIDTEVNPARPAGAALLRLILVATFFVRPEGAL
jgi:hypothetical protein